LAARDAMSFSVHGTRDFVGMRALVALAAAVLAWREGRRRAPVTQRPL
jgi:hypothetical protein